MGNGSQNRTMPLEGPPLTKLQGVGSLDHQKPGVVGNDFTLECGVCAGCRTVTVPFKCGFHMPFTRSRKLLGQIECLALRALESNAFVGLHCSRDLRHPPTPAEWAIPVCKPFRAPAINANTHARRSTALYLVACPYLALLATRIIMSPRTPGRAPTWPVPSSPPPALWSQLRFQRVRGERVIRKKQTISCEAVVSG